MTDPLGDRIKALIISGDTSGSEHGGDDSPSLSNLVDSFLSGGDWNLPPENNESDSEGESDPLEEITFPTIIIRTDPLRNFLLSHVNKAIQLFSGTKLDKSMINRSVMGYLREIGLNAAICKTKWESSGGITAGSHEFVDVAVSNTATSMNQRYFIEIDFASEFEIARPTSAYERVLNTLPKLFVGTKEELKQIVKDMGDVAKRSLKSRGLILPPWRKNRFMQNKWFGSYKRTVNLVPLSSSFDLTVKSGFGVKCRCVGFDTVNGSLLLPATTRSR